jgi:hypothetical protein
MFCGVYLNALRAAAAIAVLSAGFLTLPAGPAAADLYQTPKALRHLVGVRSDRARNELRDRGYVRVRGAAGDQHWWRPGRDCLFLESSDERVRRLIEIPLRDCRHFAGEPDNDGGGSSAGLQPREIAGLSDDRLARVMARNGYRKVSESRDGLARFSTWWNERRNDCLSLAVRNGIVDRVEQLFEGTCR